MLRTLSAFVLVLLTTTVTAADKTPFTVDDVYRVEQITDFKISSRGDEAVYVRHFYDVNFPGRRTALWRIDGATGRREPLEHGEPDGRMPVYSRDGKWLAFVSSRLPRTSIFGFPFPTIPRYSEPAGILWFSLRTKTEGDSALPSPQHWNMWGQLTLVDPFYGRIAFSPIDEQLVHVGTKSLTTDEFEAEASSIRAVASDQGEGYEGFPPANLNFLRVTKPTDGKVVRWYNFNVAPLNPRKQFWYGDPQWTPDGKFVVCHANRSDDQESVRYSINKNYDLWRLRSDRDQSGEISDEELQPLTTNPGPDVSPRVSPDGKHVLYLSVPRKGPHMDVFNLCVLRIDTEKSLPRVLANAHDAEREADGTPPWQPTFPLRDDCWIDDVHVRVGGVRGTKTETMVFNIAGPGAAISADAKPEPEPHRNPHFKKPEANPWLEERLHGPQELVRWKSFDGLEIEGVLTLPPPELKQFAKPYPVIVNPHGGPHGASSPGFNISTQVFASAGYAVFQPNYRGSYAYGRKFLDAARFDMGGSDMQDILTGIDALIERGIVDEKRQFIFGSSYGGYSTCRLITLTDRFKAAVAQNAVTDLHAMWQLSDLQSWTEWEFGGKPWETVERDGKQIDLAAEMRDRSPTTLAHKVKTPTLMLHADHDRRVPLPMGQMFYRLLKENGCETALVIYKDERHQLWQVRHQADALNRVLDWFEKHGK